MFYRNNTCGCNNMNNSDNSTCCNDSNNSMIDCSCNQFLDEENIDPYNCSCGFDDAYSAFPENPTLAESYVPRQRLNEVYKNCVGLKKRYNFS